jgi:hypothetical protein
MFSAHVVCEFAFVEWRWTITFAWSEDDIVNALIHGVRWNAAVSKEVICGTVPHDRIVTVFRVLNCSSHFFNIPISASILNKVIYLSTFVPKQLNLFS